MSHVCIHAHRIQKVALYLFLCIIITVAVIKENEV